MFDGVGYTHGVLFECGGVELGSLEGLAGGVADAGGGAADEGEGSVAAAAEPGEDDEAEEVAEVEALGGGVEAAVDPEGGISWVRGCGPEGGVVGCGVEEAALFEDFDDVAAEQRLLGLLVVVEGAFGSG